MLLFSSSFLTSLRVDLEIYSQIRLVVKKNCYYFLHLSLSLSLPSSLSSNRVTWPASFCHCLATRALLWRLLLLECPKPRQTTNEMSMWGDEDELGLLLVEFSTADSLIVFHLLVEWVVHGGSPGAKPTSQSTITY